MRGASWAYVLILILVLERGVELLLSRRNESWIRMRGGREYGSGSTRVLFLFHGLWFAAFALEVRLRGAEPVVGPLWIALFVVALQAGRYWCISSLGRFWNTKVLVLPGAEMVRRGPYRWLRHPNYAVVAMEIALYPALFGCWLTSAFFGVANLFILRMRISREEAALADAVQPVPSHGMR